MLTLDFNDFGIFRSRVKKKWLIQAKNFWWGDRLDSRFIALYYLKNIKHKAIVDIGCSCGIVLSELDPTNFKTGLDISSQALHTARYLNKADTGILKADMLRLPFKEDSFEVAVLLGMLASASPKMQDKLLCLEEIKRILKNNGELIITTQNRDYLTLADKVNKLDYDTLKDILSTDYHLEIYGFNPFPAFPFFLPSLILERIPCIWRILYFLMKKKFMIRKCRSFLVIAKKKQE